MHGRRKAASDMSKIHPCSTATPLATKIRPHSNGRVTILDTHLPIYNEQALQTARSKTVLATGVIRDGAASQTALLVLLEQPSLTASASNRDSNFLNYDPILCPHDLEPTHLLFMHPFGTTIHVRILLYSVRLLCGH
jgi:hypothetical protein